MKRLSKSSRDYAIQNLSKAPRVYLIDNFLTHAESDHIIEKARSNLTRSTIVDQKSSGGSANVHHARSSHGWSFPKDHSDPLLQNIENRIASLTHIPVENGERLHVIHYEVGGEYKPHYDFFNRNTPGGAAHCNEGGQRIATLIMYLHTPEDGGETIFPFAKIKVKPVKGNAVLFYNCKPDGQEDPLSLHGGEPVINGEKWIATKWLRMGIMGAH